MQAVAEAVEELSQGTHLIVANCTTNKACVVLWAKGCAQQFRDESGRVPRDAVLEGETLHGDHKHC